MILHHVLTVEATANPLSPAVRNQVDDLQRMTSFGFVPLHMVAGVGLISLGAGLSEFETPSISVFEGQPALMGQISAPSVAEVELNQLFAEMDSEIDRLNAGVTTEPSGELAEIIESALNEAEVERLDDEYFRRLGREISGVE